MAEKKEAKKSGKKPGKKAEEHAKIGKEAGKKKTGETAAQAKKKQAKTGEKPQEREEARKGKKTEAEIEAEMQALHTVKYPLITEKAIGMIDSQNKMTFVVDRTATKTSVRKSVEDAYKVKVKKVNIIRDMKARKRAIVTIDKKFRADDIATKLGVI